MTVKSKEKITKRLIIAVSIVLVFVLGATVFGIEYFSVVKSNKALKSQNESLISQNAEQKAQNESKVDELNKTVSDQNSEINRLHKDISSIKAMKQAQASSAAAAQNSSKSQKPAVKRIDIPTTEPIDLSYLNQSNTGDKVCYLTFDDGPSENTLKILDILKRANAKASFFVVGTSKLSYIKRTHDEGHAICLHTNSHTFSYVYKSEENYFNDLNAIKGKVKNIIGEDVTIIRFPGGSSNTVSKKYCKGIMRKLTASVQAKGYTYVDWNVDSEDATGNGVPVSKLINNVKKASKNKNQICVLMHDTNAKNTTVQALPQIIAYLRSQGYRFEPLTKSSPIFHHGVNN